MQNMGPQQNTQAAYDYPGPIFESLGGAKRDLQLADQGLLRRNLRVIQHYSQGHATTFECRRNTAQRKWMH
jgi:hypothetical protein